MQRIIYIVGIGLLAAILLMVARDVARNPLVDREKDFHARLDQVPLRVEATEGLTTDYAALRAQVAAKPALWDALVPPPPPPPVRVVRPDIQRMINGVTASRQSIGDKVKFFTKDAPKGKWVEKGETITGKVVLKDFNKFECTVAYYWEHNDEEILTIMVRE